MDISDIQEKLRNFSRERDWDQYHSPKNLAMALAAEAGELLEIYQWLTEQESNNPDDKIRKQTSEELADILIYIIKMADKLNIDLVDSVNNKIAINEKKYPKEKAKGSAKKYTEL
jgi:NTP pyrophosphatase (non-canonical NTP hydrolase)